MARNLSLSNHPPRTQSKKGCTAPGVPGGPARPRRPGPSVALSTQVLKLRAPRAGLARYSVLSNQGQ
eukprot:7787-Hanusia_phi.AAC.1